MDREALEGPHVVLLEALELIGGGQVKHPAGRSMLLEKRTSARYGVEDPVDEQTQPFPIGQSRTGPEVMALGQEFLEGEEEALGDGEFGEGKAGGGHVEFGNFSMAVPSRV